MSCILWSHCRYTVVEQGSAGNYKLTRPDNQGNPPPSTGSPFLFVYAKSPDASLFQLTYVGSVGSKAFYTMTTKAGTCVEAGIQAVELNQLDGNDGSPSALSEQTCVPASRTQLFSFIPSTGTVHRSCLI